MNADELTVGMQVRYGRTGTTGKVTRIEQLKGDTFAEVDTTQLLYRVDQLAPATTIKERKEKRREKDMDQVQKEREYMAGAGFQDAVTHTDQSCEGGG
jgi:hypothetical protein